MVMIISGIACVLKYLYKLNELFTTPYEISGMVYSNINQEKLPEFNFKQIPGTIMSFKKTLDLIMEENIRLKYRVSEILKNGFDRNGLQQLEIFQDSFIKEDELIGLLRNDIAEIYNLQQDEITGAGVSRSVIADKLNLLEKNITNTQKQFFKIRSAFNHFVVQLH